MFNKSQTNNPEMQPEITKMRSATIAVHFNDKNKYVSKQTFNPSEIKDNKSKKENDKKEKEKEKELKEKEKKEKEKKEKEKKEKELKEKEKKEKEKKEKELKEKEKKEKEKKEKEKKEKEKKEKELKEKEKKEKEKEKKEQEKIDKSSLLKRASKVYDKTKDDACINTVHKQTICTKDDSWQDIKVDLFAINGGLNDGGDISKFDENKYRIRKYTKENINNGKQFFKLRFIKKKINNTDDNKNKSTFSSFFSKKSSSELNMSNLDKEKNYRIYNSEFLLRLEKAIISFNQKNYKESFELLKNSEVIRTVKEFGEFLLVVSGFDKYLIGEFLAKQKEPNEKGEVLNAFIDSINMKNDSTNSLLECVRFLLSRINLPKDANLILVIMETFTNNFYKRNEQNKDFVDTFGKSDNIYLLVSTLLALNTMFTRKDIKNMNTIKKDEFINMNNQIKKDYLSNLYDQLKNKPITMSDDYYESIYQKFTPMVNEETKKPETKNAKSSKSSKKEQSSKIETVNINFDDYTKEDEELLKNTNKFYKISGAKTPNLYDIRILEEDNKVNKLIWDKNLDVLKPKKSNTVYIKDINEVYNCIDIADKSSQIKKYMKANPNEEKLWSSYISISYNNNKESLNLKSDNVDLTLKWFKALKSLVNKVNREESSSKNEEEIREREKTKEEIWDLFIFKKWEKYGNYLLLKIQERNNYYNYLSNDSKHSTKNELLEEKKLNTKYLNNFIDNIRSTLNKKDIEINEFYFLCNLGFPSYLRKKIWPILIGNPCCITSDLYKSIKEKIVKSEYNLNFEELEKKYNKNKDTSFNKDTNINKMIIDTLLIKSFVLNEILEQQRNIYEFMLSVYRTTRLFFIFRKDIQYNKSFVDIIAIFTLVEDNEENVFINVTNFLLSNNFIKLLIGNEDLRKEINNNNIALFNHLIKNKLPKIEAHFRNLEIIPELYFIPWMDDLYIKTLNIKIVLLVFDLYLTNGEYVLFQVGLTILKIMEDELTNMTISQVLELLKSLPDKYKKEKFQEVFINYYGIKSDYVERKRNNELERQKEILNRF